MKKDHIVLIAFILIPLYLLSVISFLRPVQAVSEDENRTLKQMPEFSWHALASGEFTRSFEDFYADQFPFRQFFINTNKKVMDLLKKPFAGEAELIKKPDGEIDLGEGEKLEPDPDDKVVFPTATPTQSSETTPRPTAQPTKQPTPTKCPAPSPTPTATPEPTSPQVTGAVEKVSGVIIVNGRAMELFYFSESRSERYVKLVNQLQEKLPDVQVYSLVAPTSVEFYSPEKYHSLSSSQHDAISNIYSRLDPAVRTVDAYGELIAYCQDYIYFRTDHHWTARGAWCAYKAFSKEAGFTPYDLKTFKSGVVPGDFLGSLYRYTKSDKLKENPDYVEYFLPLVESEGIAFDSTKMNEGYKIKAVSTTVNSSNKYLAFIQGDNPMVRLTTSLKNGKKIVVLKESFGNALVPFLLNHYEEVYVIDPRSLKADLPQFVKQNGIQEILIVNYAFAITNEKWLDGFEAMIK
ncbi:MAG: hypothetical protein KBG64_03725 [Clostridia bacterium]|nr:hypothetical protein [Clostridia bacterium]